MYVKKKKSIIFFANSSIIFSHYEMAFPLRALVLVALYYFFSYTDSSSITFVIYSHLYIIGIMLQIRYIDEYNFDVIDGDHNFCVDIAIWTCTCGKFQLDQLPCEHVLVVVRRSAYKAYDL